VADLPSAELLPEEHVISNEEESILWRSLEHIPHMYREPIILFYREGQSIENVAEALELSEEAVKQRLSRGRKLLKKEVELFVETALRQSAPGKRFTSAVLAGLPMLDMPTGASVIGAAATKGPVTTKSGSLLGPLAGLMTPILGALGGFLSMVGVIKSAQSRDEKKIWIITEALFLLFFIGGLAVHLWLGKESHYSPLVFCVQFFGGLLVLLIGIVLTIRLRRKIRAQQGSEMPAFLPSFTNPELKGFKWNMYAWLLATTFGNPFAYLSVYAAKAHDSMVASFIFASILSLFFVGKRIYLQKREQAIHLWQAIMLIQFPLMLAVIYLRWERWTGQSPWQIRGTDLILPVIGFLLFVEAIILWMIKRHRTAAN